MAGLPHQRFTTVLTYPWCQMTRAFDVVQDLRRRMAREHIFGKQHQLAVWIDNLPILGNHTKTVTITIKGQADFSVRLTQTFDQILQVFRMGRIRMVIREITIHFTEQLNDFTTELTIKIAGKSTCYAITAVNCNFHWTCKLDVINDALLIGGSN